MLRSISCRTLTHVADRLLIGLALLIPFCFSTIAGAQSYRIRGLTAQKLFTPPRDPLAGPDINQFRPTDNSLSALLEHHLDGSIVSLGNLPEIVILKHLDLTPTQRNAINEIRIKRGAVLSKAARQHYSQLLEFGSLASSGVFEQNKILFLMRLDQLARGFEDYFSRGSFISEVNPILTPEQQEISLRLLGEYRDAQVWSKKYLHHDKRSEFEILLDLRMDEFGNLIGESIEAEASLEQDNFQRFIHFLQLTPKQISQVEAIYQEIGVQTLLGNKVSAVDQLAAYAQVHQILTPIQRAKLRREVLRGNFNLEQPPLSMKPDDSSK